jgi:hypothetical protein
LKILPSDVPELGGSIESGLSNEPTFDPRRKMHMTEQLPEPSATIIVRHGFMAGRAIAFTERVRILERNLIVCRHNFKLTARFRRLQPCTRPGINDPAECKVRHRTPENHQIYHNHQICHCTCVNWEAPTVRFVPSMVARQGDEISKESRQSRLPHSLSSAYSEGLQHGGIVAPAQIEEGACIGVIPSPRGPNGAAARLGMKRTTLAYRIRKLNIPLRPQ